MLKSNLTYESIAHRRTSLHSQLHNRLVLTTSLILAVLQKQNAIKLDAERRISAIMFTVITHWLTKEVILKGKIAHSSIWVYRVWRSVEFKFSGEIQRKCVITISTQAMTPPMQNVRTRQQVIRIKYNCPSSVCLPYQIAHPTRVCHAVIQLSLSHSYILADALFTAIG